MKIILLLFIISLAFIGGAHAENRKIDPEKMLATIDNFLEKTDTSESTITQSYPAGFDEQDKEIFNKIQKAVNKNWVIAPSTDYKNLSVSIEIGIGGDSNLTSLKITRSSGNPNFDNSLIRAVRKSIPLPIPPEKREKFAGFELFFGSPSPNS